MYSVIVQNHHTMHAHSQKLLPAESKQCKIHGKIQEKYYSTFALLPAQRLVLNLLLGVMLRAKWHVE